MTNHDNNPLREEIYRLTEATLRNEATDAEFDRLETLINSDPAASEYYLKYVSQSILLSRWAMADNATKMLQATDGVDQSGTLTSLSANATAPSSPTDISIPMPQSDLGNGLIQQPKSSSWPTWTLGTILAFAFVLAALVFSNINRFTDQANPTGVATLTSPTEQTVDASESKNLQTIKLDSGIGRFTLPKVGYLITEGPTHLEILGQLHARLRYGNIRVRVTEKTGYGFTIETPDGKVTDLGTEFALNVTPGVKSSLLVSDGEVNLQVAGDSQNLSDSPVELLKQGDGVLFRKGCETERLMSIVSTDDAHLNPSVSDTKPASCTIKEVSDNLQKSDTKKFYQIVPGGMKNDALAYIDRAKYRWTGSDLGKKIPSALVGADYVKMFNQDKINSDLIVKVTLNEPCELYVLFDSHLQLPDWLINDFTRCEELIGINYSDTTVKKMRGTRQPRSGTQFYDRYTIWKRTIHTPGTIELGSNFAKGAINFRSSNIEDASMYGIVAVPLKPAVFDSGTVAPYNENANK